MVLAYDAKREAPHAAFSEGRITRIYYEGEHMFEIEEEERWSSWPRPGDSSWFVVGWRARIEHTRARHPEVLRIWIAGPG